MCSQIAIVVGLTLALPVWAKPLKKSIELYSPARLGNKALLAGQYELIVDDKTAMATFEKNNKVVAEIPYQLIRVAKASTDALVFDEKGELTEIDFSGKSQAIEFSDDSVSGSPTPNSLGNR
jgi:hypothetical protein